MKYAIQFDGNEKVFLKIIMSVQIMMTILLFIMAFGQKSVELVMTDEHATRIMQGVMTTCIK